MGYLYNFILASLCIIIVYSKIKANKELSRTDYKSVGNFIYILFVLVFAYSLYTGAGGDNERYKSFAEGGYKEFFYTDYFGFEELYVYIAMFTKDFMLWKMVVYGLAIVLTIWSIKRLQVDNLVTLMAFVLIPFMSYGTTRAVLAYSIFTYGYTFLHEKNIYKKILGLVIIFLSWQAHSSMILPILLTPFTFLKLTKKRLYLLLLLFPIVVLLFNNYYLLFLGSSSMEDSLAATKFNSYNEHEYATAVSTVGSLLRIIFGFVLIPPVIVGLKGVYSNTIEVKFHHIIKISFLMIYMSYVIYFSELENGTFFNRYFTMVPFFLYIAMSGISLEQSITPKVRRLYLYFVLAYVSIQLLYEFYCWILN